MALKVQVFMPPHIRFRFGEYVVDPLVRSVFKSGHPQTPEPKVFDAIVFLISQRHRVVTKQELLDEVWGSHVVVTEGVVARTIMKARRLIGDDADEPAIIRTVHRVGYRFVATAEEELSDQGSGGNSSSSATRAARSDTATGRLAILPFHNQTGRPDLAWVDLGLMSTTIDSLACTAGISVVPAADLLAVVGAQDGGVALEISARKIADALGASDVVQASLRTGLQGNMTLEYRGVGSRVGTLSGQVSGFDPIALCSHLCVDVRACMLPAAASTPATAREASNQAGKDAQFVNGARSRALHAMHIERWELARKLLRVALDIAPNDIALRLDYGRCLVVQRDPQVAPLLEQVLEQARALRDPALELRALYLYATWLHGTGTLDEAERMLSDALKIAEAQQDQETELQLLVLLGQTLTSEGRTAVAAWMIDRAAQLAAALGNWVATARLLDVRGRIATIKGDEEAAMAAFSEAAALSERYGIFATAAFSVAHLGNSLVNSGQMAAAAKCYDRAFEHACQSGNPVSIGTTGCYAVRFGGERRGDVAHASSTLRKMRQFAGASLLADGCADFCEALVRVRTGRLEEGCQLLERAEQKLASSRSFAFHSARQRTRVLVCLGRLEEAAELCDAIQQRVLGRLRRPAIGAVAHCRALIARANGSDCEALGLLRQCAAELPYSIDRVEALLDASWLLLESGDVVAARQTLAGIEKFMQAALASEYGPAMLVHARLCFADGDLKLASSLQRRYCELMQCAPDSGAFRCLEVFEHATSESPRQLPAMRGLPSLFELAPGMESTRSRHHA